LIEKTAENGRAKGYKELVVWQRSVRLAKEVYQLTQAWPIEERFGLTSQVRRAAISVPSNLAEGQGRFGPGEFARFVSIAHGSLCELETQLIVATEIGIVSASQIAPVSDLAGEVGRMLRALHRSLQT
jgi:carbamoyl-phosphate synthase large subunit